MVGSKNEKMEKKSLSFCQLKQTKTNDFKNQVFLTLQVPVVEMAINTNDINCRTLNDKLNRTKNLTVT